MSLPPSCQQTICEPVHSVTPVLCEPATAIPTGPCRLGRYKAKVGRKPKPAAMSAVDLIKLRRDLGMTGAQMARVLGVHKAELYRYEHGTRVIHAVIADKARSLAASGWTCSYCTQVGTRKTNLTLDEHGNWCCERCWSR